MNESSTKAKQQIIEKIKGATNILITVSKNPTVDQLSASLGLTALLDKMGKHATAIFSGIVPPAISFLNPDAVFEDTADSLRDFIIALDKDKADHLRYKLEGDVVKIFITPYRTSITADDLEFSQGDYNVELVLALGVASQEHLDEALIANGQIMDDATIATLSFGTETSKLGSIDWHDEMASGLSEMVASLADGLKADKTILDKQISTALLTGIVSATERFSNASTSSQVMNVSAQLMAAGADQQLIAAKLQENHAIQALPNETINEGGGSPKGQVDDSSSLLISHDLAEPSAEPILPPLPEVKTEETPIISTEPVIAHDVKSEEPAIGEPSIGGTLNATTEQAAEEARLEAADPQNKTILSHEYVSDPNQTPPINGSVMEDTSEQSVNVFEENTPASTLPPASEPSIDLPLPPPLPDFSTLPKGEKVINPPTLDTTAPINITELNNSTLPPTQSADDALANQLAQMPNVTDSTASTVSTLPPEPAKIDPAQFQIPSQK